MYKQQADDWHVAVDNMSINGKVFSLAATGQFTALLDTGTTEAYLPPIIVDVIYNTIPGAVDVSAEDLVFQWLLPCNGATNLTFTIG